MSTGVFRRVLRVQTPHLPHCTTLQKIEVSRSPKVGLPISGNLGVRKSVGLPISRNLGARKSHVKSRVK